ncbi:MAG: sugar phosphate isomerase/epimerase family protein [Propionibacteriaceae bacterium]
MITLSASTLGAPGDTLPQVLAHLEGAQVHAVELRLTTGELLDPAMTRAARGELRRRLDTAGIRVTGIASYVRVAADQPDDVVVGALVAAFDVAVDLGAPAVRVFPGAPCEPGPYDQVPTLTEPRPEVDARAARRLSAVAGYAAESGVLPCLETHDSHPTAAHVAAVLQQVDGPVGVVWDLMHPWRVGEPLATSWALLEPWLRITGSSVQVKDARLPDDPSPRPIGTGTLPVEEFAALLVGVGYAGPVTLEWERAWYPAALPLDDALRSVRAWVDRHWPAAAQDR